MNNWYYNNTQITDIPIQHKKSVGFIYAFYFDSGHFYFGQKLLSLSKKRKIAESTAKKMGKSNVRKYKSKSGKNKGQWVYYIDERDNESWKEYLSSSDLVKEMIGDGQKYKKEILEFVDKKGALLWKETKRIICSDCLENELCLNQHVLSKFFKKNIMGYQKT